MFRADDKTEYETLVAENEFINGVQMAVERAMKEKDLSQAQLARALSVSEARVSQILSGNGKNLQARTIARIAYVLGFQAVVEFADWALQCKEVEFKRWKVLVSKPTDHRWNDEIANENENVWASAA